MSDPDLHLAWENQDGLQMFGMPEKKNAQCVAGLGFNHVQDSGNVKVQMLLWLKLFKSKDQIYSAL